MNKLLSYSIVFGIFLTTLLFPSTASADGIIIPDPIPCMPVPCPTPISLEQLEIRYHHVEIAIQDQIAITHVDQVFYNPNDWQIEGTYIFPIPYDAVVTNFVLWVDGKPIQGQVLDADQARIKYQDIVNTMKDPALLEYVGRGAVQAHIFPIPAGGERRIELEYTQALNAENGLVNYIYPLSTEKFSTKALESVIINVTLESSSPIRAVYSPTHEVAIVRESDRKVKVGYEGINVLPDSDFSLYYSLGESEAFHVLTYRDSTDPVDPDGFFLLMLAPRIGTTTQAIPKDILLVLDKSGSMDGEKFSQAQEALRFILAHLNPDDRFNIISFSTGTQSYANELLPASEAAEARRWVDGLSAQGSTDINLALLEAISYLDSSSGGESRRPAYLIFLTDGLPTEGEVDSQNILDNLRSADVKDLRLFTFGLGYDVDTFLLDSLAQENHGQSSYVLPDEKLDEKLSTFYAKISTPVLTDLELDFGGLSAYDLYPNPLPDLFVGSQIIAVGRYRDGGSFDITLNGVYNNEPQKFRFDDQAFDSDSSSLSEAKYIPHLWATRKIGYLLNQIRLNGPDQETIDQIVRISIRYGIVTPYTSYLVTEDMALGEEAQARIADEAYSQMAEAPAASVVGQEAVQKSADQNALAGAGSAYEVPAEVTNRVKVVGARTFVLMDDVWVDTGFDPDSMVTKKVAFLSQDYYSLINLLPDLAAAFALGEKVIAFSDGIAYEVVAEGDQVKPLEIYPSNSSSDEQISSPTQTSPIISTEETESTPVSETPSGNRSGNGLCAAGLLPLLLIPMGFLLTSGKKQQ